MSDVIKSVFINYFTCTLLGGIMEYILPAKSRKTFKVCVVCVTLLVSLSPILNLDFSFSDLRSYEDVQVQEKYNSIMHVTNLMENKIYSQAKQILINSGVSEYEIYIDTSYDEATNTVYLNRIFVELGKDFKDKQTIVYNAFPQEYKGILEVGVKNE